MTVRVGVLGRLEVRDESGNRLEISAPRQRALLALLASRAPAVVSVDTIIDQLWPEGPGDGAIGTVQAYVSYLRRVVEPGPERNRPTVLVTRAPGYALAIDPASVDAQAVVVAARDAAEALTRNDPVRARDLALEALGLVRGEPFEDQGDLPFAIAERIRLGEVIDTLHEIAATAKSTLGIHGPAVARLSALLERRPLRESAAAALMSAQFRAGNQAAALATYDRTRKVLAEELGVDPSPQLADLHRRVLSQDPELLRPAPSAPPATEAEQAPTSESVATPMTVVSPETDGHPFVGRRAEWDQLVAALATAWAPVASAAPVPVVLVAGEAGIGKSHLARRLESYAATQGWAVLAAHNWDDEGAPSLAAWAQLVDGLLRRQPSPPPPETVLTLLGGSASGPDLSDRRRLVTDLAEVVRRAADAAPTLLVLEDVHWAGAEAMVLLRDVLTACAGARLVVVCTLRTTDVPDDVQRVLAQLRRMGARQLDLMPLPDEQVAELVNSLVDGPIDDERRRTVIARSGGNPLFAVELVRALRQRGARGDVPDGVRDLVLWRSARLPQATVTLLQTASVLGRRVDVDLLAAVASEGVDDVYDALEPAVAVGLLDTQDGLAFAHALMRDAFYDSLGFTRRMRAHLRAADVLEARLGPGGGARAAEVVHHLDGSRSPDPGRLVTALVAAGRDSATRFAYDDATAGLQRARTLLADQPETEERLRQELDISMALGTLSTHRHGFAAPETAVERARTAALVERVGGPVALLGASVGASSFATVSARFDEGERHGARLVELGEMTGDPVARAAGMLQVAWVHWHRGDMRVARHELEDVWRLADTLADPLPLDALIQHPAVMGRVLAGCAATQCGDAAEGIALCAEGVAVAEGTGHRFTQAMAGLFTAWRQFVGRDVPELVESAATSLKVGGEEGFPNVIGPSLALLGWGRVLLGDQDGETMVATARQAMADSGARFLGGWFGGLLGEAALLRSDLATARLELTGGLQACAQTGERFYEAELWRLLASVDRAEGDVSGARECLRRAESVGVAQGSLLYAERARADLESLG